MMPHGDFLAAQQRRPQRSAVEKIEILLEIGHIAALPDQVEPGGVDTDAEHLTEMRVAQVLQTVATGLREELVQKLRIVVALQIVVKDHGVALGEQACRLLAQRGMVGIVVRGQELPQPFQERPISGRKRSRVRLAAAMILTHPPDHFAQLAAGIAVVADVGDSFGSQESPAGGQHCVLDPVGHPRINAVRNDIIERPKTIGQRFGRLANIERLEHDIRQPEGIRERPAFGNLPL